MDDRIGRNIEEVAVCCYFEERRYLLQCIYDIIVGSANQDISEELQRTFEKWANFIVVNILKLWFSIFYNLIFRYADDLLQKKDNTTFGLRIIRSIEDVNKQLANVAKRYNFIIPYSIIYSSNNFIL